MFVLKYQWALIVQNMETGRMEVWKTFIDGGTCEQIAETMMVMYPWFEAGCFLVY